MLTNLQIKNFKGWKDTGDYGLRIECLCPDNARRLYEEHLASS